MELFFYGVLSALFVISIIFHMIDIAVEREFRERDDQSDKREPSCKDGKL